MQSGWRHRYRVRCDRSDQVTIHVCGDGNTRVPSSLLITAMSAPEAISSDGWQCRSPWNVSWGSSSPWPLRSFWKSRCDVGRIERPSVPHGDDVTLGLPRLLRCLSLLGLRNCQANSVATAKSESATVRSPALVLVVSARSHDRWR